MEDQQALNAFIDAQEIAKDMTREFVEADLTQYMEHGVDLLAAAVHFTRQYAGDNRFVVNVLKKRLNQWGTLTQGQARAALNVMRQELCGINRPNKVENKRELECFTCHEKFPTWDELNAHKSSQHGSKKAPETFTDKGDAAPVLEVNTSVKGLDLSNLPDGRYAAPDPSGKNDNIFLVVKRVRKTVHRDRRYNYGKIVTGNEIVVAGTIEVRIWSSDTKEWVGAQKPGDVYRGKFEDQLELIMMMPEPFAILFGRLLGYCGRCGKQLTDQVSRQIGLGLDCEKQRAYFTSKPKYTYIGTDRPEPAQANPFDEGYLTGKFSRWIEPPKVVIRAVPSVGSTEPVDTSGENDLDDSDFEGDDDL